LSVELGIFARTFTRTSATDVAAAVAGAGFTATQFNLSSIGLPTLPGAETQIDFGAINAAFSAVGVRIWGLSATYNVIHPDLAVRRAATAKAIALIAHAPEIGAEVVTLCSGSRDSQDMWRAHPGNAAEDAWWDLRSTLDELLPAAEQAGVLLGIEPEPGNVVSDAAHGARLLDELGPGSERIGMVLDAANLVSPSTLDDQEHILRSAFELLGPQTVALHAKDVVRSGGFSAAGRGGLDYPLIFDLHAALPHPVPVIIQDAEEDDVGRTREFLLGCSSGRQAGRTSGG
jgi:sugar phosphate isomerase/epimerase